MEEDKLYAFGHDMVLYLEDHNDSITKSLDLINIFGKVKEFKINIQKSIVFLYANNEQAEKEISKTILFITA
jgi:hypothetical protein